MASALSHTYSRPHEGRNLQVKNFCLVVIFKMIFIQVFTNGSLLLSMIRLRQI